MSKILIDEATVKLALEALFWANNEINEWRDDAHGYKPEDQPVLMSAITALREALAEPQEKYQYGTPLLDAMTGKANEALDKKAENARELGLDYEPCGMHHNKPQKRPQNCGTGYCSCIECVMEKP